MIEVGVNKLKFQPKSWIIKLIREILCLSNFFKENEQCVEQQLTLGLILYFSKG